MTWTGVAKFLWELGSELWHERQRRKARSRAAEHWATTSAPARACPRCREIAYVPGQTTCTKCGAAL